MRPEIELSEKIMVTLHNAGVCPCNYDPVIFALALFFVTKELTGIIEEGQRRANLN